MEKMCVGKYVVVYGVINCLVNVMIWMFVCLVMWCYGKWILYWYVVMIIWLNYYVFGCLIEYICIY